MKLSNLEKIFDLSIKSPKLILSLWMILLVIILSFAKPFKMLITIDGLINENFETSKNYRNLREKFEEGTPLLLLNKNGLRPTQLCLTRYWLSNLPKSEDHLLRSYSLFSLRRPKIEDSSESFSKLTFHTLLKLDCTKQLKMETSEIEKSPWNGVIFKKDTGSFLTELRFSPLGEKNFQSKTVPKIIDNLRDTFPKDLQVQTSWLGQASYQYFMKEGLKINNALNGLLLLIVLILMKVFLGTWRSGLFFIGTLLFSAALLFILMSATSTPLDVLNNSLFILLSVASLGDFIFICHYQLKHNTSWQESFRAVLIPSFFTSLTTFLGFLSLLTSELEIVQRLGLWAAFSGLIEWLVLFSLTPALLMLLKSFKSFSSPTPTSSLKKLYQLEEVQLSKPIVFIFFIVYLLSPFSPLYFNINDNPTMLFPKRHEFYQGIEKLKETFGFSGEVSLVLERKNSLEDDLRLMNKLTVGLGNHPSVVKIESPVDLIEFTTEGFEENISDLIRSNLKNTAAYRKLIHEETLRSKVYLSKTSLKDINEMRLHIEKNICKDIPCSLSGAMIAYAEFSQTVPKTLLTSLGTSLIMVFLTLLFLWSSKRKGPLLPLLISGFWGVAFILVLLAITQFKLNFVTCVVLAILVGMTGDNAIHYLLSKDNLLEGIMDKQGASILTTTIMSFCCIVFFFFSFQPPRVLGVLLIFGLWGSLAGDLWFLKSIIKKGRN